MKKIFKEPEEITDFSKICGDCEFYKPCYGQGFGICKKSDVCIKYRKYRNIADHTLVGTAKIACSEFKNK